MFVESPEKGECTFPRHFSVLTMDYSATVPHRLVKRQK